MGRRASRLLRTDLRPAGSCSGPDAGHACDDALHWKCEAAVVLAAALDTFDGHFLESNTMKIMSRENSPSELNH